MPMACPHCGTHLLQNLDGELHCCGCGRPRVDLNGTGPFQVLRRHAPLLLAGLLCVPLALGITSLDGLWASPAGNGAATGAGAPARELATR